MNVAVDTNVLVRAAVGDDAIQEGIAAKLLAEAEFIAIAPTTLCELAWVLSRSYGFNASETATAIRSLLSSTNVVTNRAAAEFGLVVFEAGGDFADGVNAYEGRWLGGETFVSFDRRAVALISAAGQSAQLL